MRWPWSPRGDISISDPVLADYFGVTPTYAGVNVGEASSLGISAFWRALSLISGTIASLPMRSLRDTAAGQRQPMASWLDNPGGPDGPDEPAPTAYEWKETCALHLLLHGNAFGAHVYNHGGALVGLQLIHPGAVQVEPPSRDKPVTTYKTALVNGRHRLFTKRNMTHIMGPSLDGIRGMSLLTVARNSLGTAIAGDRAAARMFGSGALISGLVTPEEDVDEGEAKTIKDGLDRKVGGWENAGQVAFVNRKLKFSPWTMSAADAQFIESRAFQIEEVARWTGVPPHLLMQTEKQTSWGTGVAEQNRGLSRFTLLGWTSRIEQRLSRLLPAPRWVEFDFVGLERPTPEQEIQLLIAQVQAGILTVDEARRVRNLPPLTEPAEQAELEEANT